MYLKRDSDGQIGEFNNPQPGFSTPTQSEIDAYLLIQAKENKNNESQTALSDFRALGFVYTGWTFALDVMSAMYVKNKDDQRTGGVNKYKFYDEGGTQRNFTDATGFSTFRADINEEDERIMELWNSYKGQIAACTTITEVDAITLDYSV